MKLVRFKADGAEKFGVLRDGIISEAAGNIFDDITEFSVSYSPDEVTLLPPTRPTKIVAVGLNYKEHARELSMEMPKEPLIFLKPISSIIASGENIVYPEMSSHVDYEGELGVIIKKRAKNVAKSDAKDYILGYTCVNDVTARDLQMIDVQFTRAKSFDTFCPIGPCIQTGLDPENVTLRTYVNGELKQESSTSDMIFCVYYMVSFISRIMTLNPGDLITTGTPKGVGSIVRGDEVVVEIENIGRLKNRVV
jgi:2-keto-4-pentenoate hydratase/2-oxohepta-3-ene-1,7-dioic acid hydratase in catechol pathway